MSEVHVKDGESLENALKRFKRSCAKSGVLAEVRKREHYESPSVKRRKKSEAARKNVELSEFHFTLRNPIIEVWMCVTFFLHIFHIAICLLK